MNTKEIPTPLQYAGLRPATTWKEYSGQWQGERIAFLLKNEVYIGNMVQGRVQKASYKSKKILKKPEQEWIVVQGTHQPIIKKEQFEQVQQILQKRAKTRVRKYDYLWKGLIYCGICNRTASVIARQLKQGQILYLCCRNGKRVEKQGCGKYMIREDLLKEQVVSHFKRRTENRIDWEMAMEQAVQEFEEQKTERREQEKTQIQHINVFLERLYQDFAKGLLTKEDFERIYQAKKQERALLQTRLQYEAVRKQRKLTIGQCQNLFWETVAKEKGFWFSIIERIELISSQNVRVYFRFRE